MLPYVFFVAGILLVSGRRRVDGRKGEADCGQAACLWGNDEGQIGKSLASLKRAVV